MTRSGTPARGRAAPAPSSRAERHVLAVGKLGRRLIAAFIGVVLATLLLYVLIATTSTNADLDHFVHVQEVTVADTTAMTAGTAFHGGKWDIPGLRSATDTAAIAGAGVQVLSSGGKVLVQSPHYAGFPATTQIGRSITTRGSRVGFVRVRFGPGGLRASLGRLNAQRWSARVLAFVLALALAVAVSVLMAMRITAPLERLLAAVRARGAGDRKVRITDLHAVGELGELLQVFNAAADEVDQRDQAQRALVDNTAHELRTPVAILQAGTESMLDGLSEPTRENLASLHDEVLRLSQRLDDLQALARANSATIRLTLADHNLDVIARDAADRLADSYEAGNVRLHLDLEPVTISCDHQRMLEVITNLMTNALKYSRPGGSVTVETVQSDHSHAFVRVTDTGIGIPADELPRVTERFFRGAGSPAVASGSGIGLAIVEELARAQHGTLHITSQVGSGTQVTVTFPLEASQRSRRAFPGRAARSPGS
jgi:two-component system, OmpR family, sensor histidine kinase BaeS